MSKCNEFHVYIEPLMNTGSKKVFDNRQTQNVVIRLHNISNVRKHVYLKNYTGFIMVIKRNAMPLRVKNSFYRNVQIYKLVMCHSIGIGKWFILKYGYIAASVKQKIWIYWYRYWILYTDTDKLIENY